MLINVNDLSSYFLESGAINVNYNIYKNQLDYTFLPPFINDPFDEYTRRRGTFYKNVTVQIENSNHETIGKIKYSYEPDKNTFSYNRKLISESYYKEGYGSPFKQINYSYNDYFNYVGYWEKVEFPEHFKSHFTDIGTYMPTYCIQTKKRIFYNRINERLIEKQITEYFGTNQLQTNIEYNYGNNGFLIQENTTNSDGSTITQKITYPHSYPEQSATCGFADDPMTRAIKTMRDKNMLNYPIELKTMKDGKVIDGKLNLYRDHNNNSVVLDKQYVLGINQAIDNTSFTNSYVHQEANCNKWFGMDSRYYLAKEYDVFNNKGKLIQYHNDNDINVVNVWGYNNSYIVAKIENSKFQYVTQALSNVSLEYLQTKTSAELMQIFDELRIALPDAMITSYTYDPLIGKTSETNPAGITTYYEYDSFGRLKAIKNKDGDIIETYDYHYQNQ